uniref:HECT domain-containing protein n=1 Tax=Aegilops tauschii subsp. strangulata TaxID=200361 RepID=A0A453AFS6_AEGTS
QVLRGSLPDCVPESVHDVKLADADGSSIASIASDNQTQPSSGSSIKHTFSSRGAGSVELRNPSTLGSRGAMSFAAAAMAGLASVGSRGIRGSQDRRGLPLGTSAHEHSNKLIFTAGGKQLSKHLTVYQAMQQQVVHDEDDEERLGGSDLPNDGSRLWSDVFTITYQKADNEVDRESTRGSSLVLKSSKSELCRATSQEQCTSLLDSILQGELPCDIEKSTQTYNILALLRVLEGLNQLSPRLRLQATCDDFIEGKVATLDGLYGTGAKVPSEEFISSKLTPKLARQIQDVLALCSGSLPSWCYQMTKACPFLFPFETRRQHFYSTAFGLSRALNRLQQQQGDNNSSATEREVRIGRLQRQKVRVSRNRILDSAAKVMEMFSNQKAVLEVEYFGEVGTGLGPTLEFYTLLSHDLQRVGLGLWRSDSDSLEAKKVDSHSPADSRNLIQAPLGLFPRPWPPSTASSEGSKFFKVVEYFRLVGRIMAKALQDGRLLDLPLSTAFYKLLLGQVSMRTRLQ